MLLVLMLMMLIVILMMLVLLIVCILLLALMLVLMVAVMMSKQRISLCAKLVMAWVRVLLLLLLVVAWVQMRLLAMVMMLMMMRSNCGRARCNGCHRGGMVMGRGHRRRLIMVGGHYCARTDRLLAIPSGLAGPGSRLVMVVGMGVLRVVVVVMVVVTVQHAQSVVNCRIVLTVCRGRCSQRGGGRRVCNIANYQLLIASC